MSTDHDRSGLAAHSVPTRLLGAPSQLFAELRAISALIASPSPRAWAHNGQFGDRIGFRGDAPNRWQSLR
jgi:hypothetical protein